MNINISPGKKLENRAEFTVDGIDSSFANLYRRYFMSMVPVLAIDSVVFYDNNGPVWDEYVAHRLGLLPVITPNKLSKNAEFVLTLDAEGPRQVMASDIKSSDEEIKVAKDSIVIITLGEKQKLRFEAKVILGIGRKHAKFQAGLAGYEIVNENKMNFFVETFYQMSPSELVRRGCDKILEDLEDIENAFSKKKKDKEDKEEDNEEGKKEGKKDKAESIEKEKKEKKE